MNCSKYEITQNNAYPKNIYTSEFRSKKERQAKPKPNFLNYGDYEQVTYPSNLTNIEIFLVNFKYPKINKVTAKNHTKYLEGKRNNLLREDLKSSKMNGTNRQIIAITVMVKPCLIRTCRNLEI